MENYSVVGKPLIRVDARAKATGEAKFTDDFSLPQMLRGKILRSPYPHARILRIDTSRAEKLPGVKAIITGKDTRGIRFGFVDTPGIPADEYPLAVDKVRYIGEEVAAVAATDEDTAEEALSLIKVEYEELPAVFDPEEALKEGAPLVHEEIVPPSTTAWEDWGMTSSKAKPFKVVRNINTRRVISYGDIEQGFRESDYIRKDRFVIPATSHAAMEPHSALAYFEPSGELQVWLSHMGSEFKRFWLAKTLKLPLSKVRVLKSYVGGAFGGKITLFPYEFLAAFLSMKTGKPVKITLTREEVFCTTRVSHRMIIDLKTGVKKDGTLVAQEMKAINDTGAYRGSSPIVLLLLHLFSSPIYHIPHFSYEGIGVYTNKTICLAKRGHGGPQGRFAIESQLDLIARDLGLDPLEIRLRNARKAGTVLPNGDRLDSCGLDPCLRKAAEAIGWGSKKNNRGVGLGASSMFCGTALYPFGSSALVKMNPDGTATLFSGAVEFGQGSDTAMSQIAAEELGLSLEDIALVSADTSLCPPDYGNFLSGGVFITGRAVRNAATDARGQLLELAASSLQVRKEDLSLSKGRIYVKKNPDKGLSFAQIVRESEKRGVSPIMGKGYCEALSPEHCVPSISKGAGHFTDAYAFTAVAAEVELERETGKVKVHRIVLANDSGFDINPLSVEGQMESQAVMGEGDVLFEEVATEKGQVINPSFMQYTMPTAADMPRVQTYSVNSFDPVGPYGAKEAGEGARAAVIAAIANAIADASGAGINHLPFLPQKVLASTAKGK